MFISFYLGYFIFNKLLVLEYDDGDSDEDSGGIVDLNLMNELEVFILKFRVVVFELKFGVELNWLKEILSFVFFFNVVVNDFWLSGKIIDDVLSFISYGVNWKRIFFIDI